MVGSLIMASTLQHIDCSFINYSLVVTPRRCHLLAGQPEGTHITTRFVRGIYLEHRYGVSCAGFVVRNAGAVSPTASGRVW